MKRCLYCYNELVDESSDYHTQCSTKIYGSAIPPVLPYGKKDLVRLAEKVIRSQTTLTRVQPKLSLDIEKVEKSSKRFTIVGLWERYILKPQSQHYEQIAIHILKYSSTPKLTKSNFGEQVLFSWITGNSDMHLKNFFLYSNKPDMYVLTPAHDLLVTKLVIPEDSEELALTLNGKKKKIKKADFITAMQSTGLENKIIENLLDKFKKVSSKWMDFIDLSFVREETKESYKELINRQLSKLVQ